MRKNFKFELGDIVESINFKTIPFKVKKRIFIESLEGVEQEYLLERLESNFYLLAEKVEKLKIYKSEDTSH